MHELTDKLWANGMASSKIIDDNIICRYIEEKCNSFWGNGNKHPKPHSSEGQLMTHFGLSPSKEVGESCAPGTLGPGFEATAKSRDWFCSVDGCSDPLQHLHVSKPKDSEVCEKVKIFSGDLSVEMWKKIGDIGKYDPSKLAQDLHELFYSICCKLQELESKVDGTPCPKPKTLADKFYDRWCEGSMKPQEMMDDLADIAEQHYKESKGC